MLDPLEKLVVSGAEVNRELLATVLANLARIDRDSGEIRLTSEGVRLPKRLQILAYLLGRKAGKALGMLSEEAITPAAMGPQLGVEGGSLRGQLSTLHKERLVDRVPRGYLVPNYAVEDVKALLEQAAKRKEK